jgi:multidrug efflux pump
VVTDVSTDQQQKGLETYLEVDRDAAARFGISPRQINNTLYDAFGQRQVSIIYSAINQYHVVMEVDPRYTQYPESLGDVYVATSGATPRAVIERAGGDRHGTVSLVVAAAGFANAEGLRPLPTTMRRATLRSMRSPTPARDRPPPALRSAPPGRS